MIKSGSSKIDVYEWIKAEMMATTDITLDEFEEGEVWVFNSSADKPLPFNSDGKLKTMRFGKQALDINGHKLSPDYILPVYIHKSELDIMNKRWSEELAGR